jgi:hypothetical protein
MNHSQRSSGVLAMVSVSFDPVGSWIIVALVALVVTALTLWAYSVRMKGTRGGWRWLALALRLLAVLLCVLASLRPSVIFQEKKNQPTSLLVLLDDSSSMKFTDEIRGQSRWDLATKTVAQARDVMKTLGEGLTVKFYRFDSALHDLPETSTGAPEGRETALGAAMLESFSRERGTHVASIYVLSDGANNSGPAPLIAARRLKGQQVPVNTIGFGSEDSGSKSRDIAVRELGAIPSVFVKNVLQVRGTLLARGFAGQTIEVEMLVEGQTDPVATHRVKVPEIGDVVPFSLRYVPQAAGEKRVTIRVAPKEGELVQSNNEVSTYVTVLQGGLNVFFVQGPHSPWEGKFLSRSVATSPDINVDPPVIVRKSAQGGVGVLPDDVFAPQRYNVYILCDLPADYLTPTQHALLARAVERGAGLIMLGGRSSFGAGGWAGTEVARVLPVAIHPGDGQLEPPGGIKFVPNANAIESYLLQLGENRVESLRIWNELPPLTGINHLSTPKPAANILGTTPGDRPEPIMVGMDAGAGRSLAFGGETWVWARWSEESQLAHRKFWRQVIFWLAHKEDKGENEVKIKLDARRIATGQKLDFSVTARDAKGTVLNGLKYDTRVEREGEAAEKFSEKLDVFSKGEEARGTFLATSSAPGDYRVSVVASRDGKEIGRDSARFIVYQDDRELENPAADRALLRQVAEASGGESIPPEQLSKHLQSLKGKVFTESYTQTERKVWDNWPFLLIFAALLTLEWWLRKRHGWV